MNIVPRIKMFGGRGWLCFMLAGLALSAGCKSALDPSATATSYVRLLDSDPPAALASMRLAADGNLLFLYTAEPAGAGTTRIELTKTDPNGNVLWTRTFGDTGAYLAGDCLPLADGSIVLAGSRTLDTKDDALDFFHLASDGTTIDKTEQLSVLSLQAETIQTDDSGGFVVGCEAKDPLTAGNPLEVMTVVLSAQGKFIDSSVRSPSNQGYAWGFSQMCSPASGAAFAAGYSHTNQALSAPAIFEWKEPDSIFSAGTLQGAGVLRSLIRTSATTCVAAGDSAAFGNPNGSAWIGQMNMSALKGGNLPAPMWSRLFKLGLHGSVVSVFETADKGFAAAGYGVSASGDTSIAVFRLDASGNDVWPYRSYEFNGGDVPANIVELPNGDLVVGGVTTSFGNRPSGARQIFTIHLKPDGTPAS